MGGPIGGQGIPNEPGTVVVRGRELMVLNFAGEWLAPGVLQPMPPPHPLQWRVLRVGYGDQYLPPDSGTGEDEPSTE